MSGRLETVKNAYESRREATIAKLSERAGKARTRKALREKMRKEQNVGWFEAWAAAKEHVNSIPKDQRRRIASAVMNAKTHKRPVGKHDTLNELLLTHKIELNQLAGSFSRPEPS